MSSDHNGKLNKAREELQKAQDELKLDEARVEDCGRMEDMTINEIKAGVEAQINQAREEAISDTCSGFLYSLWLNHQEMDFTFFSEEAIEEVKRLAAKTAKDAEASTSLDPNEVIPPAANVQVKVADNSEV